MYRSKRGCHCNQCLGSHLEIIIRWCEGHIIWLWWYGAMACTCTQVTQVAANAAAWLLAPTKALTTEPGVVGLWQEWPLNIFQWYTSCVDSNMTVQTEVRLQKVWPISDLWPHMKVAQVKIEKITFHKICAAHTSWQMVMCFDVCSLPRLHVVVLKRVCSSQCMENRFSLVKN